MHWVHVQICCYLAFDNNRIISSPLFTFEDKALSQFDTATSNSLKSNRIKPSITILLTFIRRPKCFFSRLRSRHAVSSGPRLSSSSKIVAIDVATVSVFCPWNWELFLDLYSTLRILDASSCISTIFPGLVGSPNNLNLV
jgi:hypothetical protein